VPLRPCLAKSTEAQLVAASELAIDTSATAMEMAEAIFGDGVTVVTASYTGDNDSSGIFTGGDTTSPGVLPSDTGVILSTGDAEDFTNSSGDSNQQTNTSTNTSGENNNALFNDIAGTRTRDASYIDVDFIPTGDLMTIQFVFSSEEYPEYAGSIYNDVVGVWLDGSYVELAVGDGDSSVGNVNAGANYNLYVDNTGDEFNTEMDAFTVTMTLKIPVVSGELQSLRIGIADAGDANYDSNLLIGGDSVQTTLIADSDTDTVYVDGAATVNVLANDINPSGGVLVVTHINGVPVFAGDSVTLPTGQTVTLNADGTFFFEADSDVETVNFTYQVQNDLGQTDTGFVTVETIPCFAAGTMISTVTGQVRVENLQAGDLVHTLDDGLQPVRWIGRRTVTGRGKFTPIILGKNALGRHNQLVLSPQHRVMLKDPKAELFFGNLEVLVAAKDLVNGTTIVARERDQIEYVHILFDRHQVVISEGLETESFLPGPQISHAFAAATLEEICTIFPELDPLTGNGYGPSVRPLLKSYEARTLIKIEQAA